MNEMLMAALFVLAATPPQLNPHPYEIANPADGAWKWAVRHKVWDHLEAAGIARAVIYQPRKLGAVKPQAAYLAHAHAKAHKGVVRRKGVP